MKPLIVRSYNQHMGGVDHVDQQLHGIHVTKTLQMVQKVNFSFIVTVYAKFVQDT